MVTLTIDNRLRLSPVHLLPRTFLRILRTRFTFSNPKWGENRRLGFSNWNTPSELCLLEEDGPALTLPRGSIRQLLNILTGSGVRYHLKDRRCTLPMVDFQFQGDLRGFQEEAVDKVLQKDFGVLCAPTGSGKTVMALALIAQRGQPTLIVVHNGELLEQWIDQIEAFLGIPAREVGRIGGG